MQISFCNTSQSLSYRWHNEQVPEMRLLKEKIINFKFFLDMIKRRWVLHFLTPTQTGQRIFYWHVNFTQHTIHNLWQVNSRVLGRVFHYSSFKAASLNFSSLLRTKHSQNCSILRKRWQNSSAGTPSLRRRYFSNLHFKRKKKGKKRRVYII